ncbi:putative transposase Ptta/En/Spm plant [Arabidopsis thaliana x Arabidopsis arenosa]|uniref:Putative transposase Ptta/En/Spm plant n=1 Tax=Arabidopsis thaliana x Arabidopsis arenosa TaxID=1240361 RepID=A0A8T2EWM2_9BRAS|nr:putative transposase Ptta/En/Spm plant [Arabidopsis thaliana x Arabidopsis arenosa]
MEEETGKEPNRAELFIVSRTKSDESLLCNEARFTLDKLSQVMTQNIQDEASKTSTESRPYDAFEQVFGYEPSGRVRCMGRGVTPSKYLLNHESMTSNTEILEMKTRLKGLEEKLDIVTDALLVLVKSKSQFQVTASATTGNKKVKTDLHQSSSINSDQENGILRTGI